MVHSQSEMGYIGTDSAAIGYIGTSGVGYIGTPVLIDSADGVYWYILKSAGILVHSQSEMGYIGTCP